MLFFLLLPIKRKTLYNGRIPIDSIVISRYNYNAIIVNVVSGFFPTFVSVWCASVSFQFYFNLILYFKSFKRVLTNYFLSAFGSLCQKTEQNFLMVLLIMICKARSFLVWGQNSSKWQSKTLVSVNRNESYREILSCGFLFILFCKVVIPLSSEDKILLCDYSNENYWSILSCSTFSYAAQGGSN